MSAVIQVYKKAACAPLDELTLAGIDYDLTLGPSTGLDGDTGDRVDVPLFIKNTGNRPAINVTLYKDNDVTDMVELRTGTQATYVKDALLIGDLVPNEVTDVYLRVTVPPGTPAVVIAPNFTFKFKSLP